MGLEMGPVAGSIRDRQFLNQLSDYQLLKKYTGFMETDAVSDVVPRYLVGNALNYWLRSLRI
jgi:hypothetical protein